MNEFDPDKFRQHPDIDAGREPKSYDDLPQEEKDRLHFRWSTGYDPDDSPNAFKIWKQRQQNGKQQYPLTPDEIAARAEERKREREEEQRREEEERKEKERRRKEREQRVSEINALAEKDDARAYKKNCDALRALGVSCTLLFVLFLLTGTLGTVLDSLGIAEFTEGFYISMFVTGAIGTLLCGVFTAGFIFFRYVDSKSPEQRLNEAQRQYDQVLARRVED